MLDVPAPLRKTNVAPADRGATRRTLQRAPEDAPAICNVTAP